MEMAADRTGSMACALQAAIRLSNVAFAAHLEISVRARQWAHVVASSDWYTGMQVCAARLRRRTAASPGDSPVTVPLLPSGHGWGVGHAAQSSAVSRAPKLREGRLSPGRTSSRPAG